MPRQQRSRVTCTCEHHCSVHHFELDKRGRCTIPDCSCTAYQSKFDARCEKVKNTFLEYCKKIKESR